MLFKESLDIRNGTRMVDLILKILTHKINDRVKTETRSAKIVPVQQIGRKINTLNKT